MKLPEEFLLKMENLLGKEYGEFVESFNKPRVYGLRVNTLKISVEEFLKISPFYLEPVPWATDGFYYAEGESPGKHPYYFAGLYYIQEPSAMFPAAVLDAKPGERVLDLCAAPGGKTVQLAAGMKGKGLLVANDINSDRVKALVKNIELCGVRNAVVTNETPERLAHRFEGFFDKILVDAPCSGEGMFRKDEEAVRSWEKYKCEKCGETQWDILQWVDRMLRPGGSFVYSTCTFSPEEDERMISRFMNSFPEYQLVDVPKPAGISCGRPEWGDGSEALARTARLWPHRLKGEGHFTALLRKRAQAEMKNPGEKDGDFGRVTAERGQVSNNNIHVGFAAFEDFMEECLNTRIEGYFEIKGGNLYCLPGELPDVSRIKIAKFGWYLGEFSRDKFIPSHSLAVSLKKGDIKKVVDLSSRSKEVLSYLRGETLMMEGEKGMTGVCVDGYTLGWGKQMGDMLKNLYPKGWRKMN
ncbi:MAG: RsmB/NOP family class I SAM-dependent RNA methyltransferase [Clostridiales bacterium]|jgi:NOL1/NOP2/sun family putative RNA methylase|nr:RsmB/NOP family class I SAM-dependent RNA methyltransferase [Eubacteriales bacterium]MDH7565538.1 RsmB/NOP family class I SAM-dependent RNA methyltransferase [Clostridiales bacterium]